MSRTKKPLPIPPDFEERYLETACNALETSKIFGHCIQTIIKWARQRDLSIRRPGEHRSLMRTEPSAFDAKVLNLRLHDGLRLQAIGNKFHISRQRVHQIVKRWGHLFT